MKPNPIRDMLLRTLVTQIERARKHPKPVRAKATMMDTEVSIADTYPSAQEITITANFGCKVIIDEKERISAEHTEHLISMVMHSLYSEIQQELLTELYPSIYTLQGLALRKGNGEEYEAADNARVAMENILSWIR